MIKITLPILTEVLSKEEMYKEVVDLVTQLSVFYEHATYESHGKTLLDDEYLTPLFNLLSGPGRKKVI